MVCLPTSLRKKYGHDCELIQCKLYTCRIIFFLHIFQSTLCYYDAKDALALAPENVEAKMLMDSLEKRAKDSRQQVTG